VYNLTNVNATVLQYGVFTVPASTTVVISTNAGTTVQVNSKLGSFPTTPTDYDWRKTLGVIDGVIWATQTERTIYCMIASQSFSNINMTFTVTSTNVTWTALPLDTDVPITYNFNQAFYFTATIPYNQMIYFGASYPGPFSFIYMLGQGDIWDGQGTRKGTLTLGNSGTYIGSATQGTVYGVFYDPKATNGQVPIFFGVTSQTIDDPKILNIGNNTIVVPFGGAQYSVLTVPSSTKLRFTVSSREVDYYGKLESAPVTTNDAQFEMYSFYTYNRVYELLPTLTTRRLYIRTSSSLGFYTSTIQVESIQVPYTTVTDTDAWVTATHNAEGVSFLFDTDGTKNMNIAAYGAVEGAQVSIGKGDVFGTTRSNDSIVTRQSVYYDRNYGYVLAAAGTPTSYQVYISAAKCGTTCTTKFYLSSAPQTQKSPKAFAPGDNIFVVSSTAYSYGTMKIPANTTVALKPPINIYAYAAQGYWADKTVNDHSFIFTGTDPSVKETNLNITLESIRPGVDLSGGSIVATYTPFTWTTLKPDIPVSASVTNAPAYYVYNSTGPFYVDLTYTGASSAAVSITVGQGSMWTIPKNRLYYYLTGFFVVSPTIQYVPANGPVMVKVQGSTLCSSTSQCSFTLKLRTDYISPALATWIITLIVILIVVPVVLFVLVTVLIVVLCACGVVSVPLAVYSAFNRPPPTNSNYYVLQEQLVTPQQQQH
jgi:uncharacterized membrane protein